MGDNEDPFECQKVGLDFFTSAPQKSSSHEIINATPDRIFDHFEDASSWPRWAMPITKVVWTSPKPYTTGSTRTVHMRGGLVGYEEFLAYDRGRHMAFRFNKVSKPGIDAFAENYLLTPLDSDRTLVEWTMAMSSSGPAATLAPVTSPITGALLRHMLRKFKSYVESR
jgi:hypothetical protein